MELGLQFWLIIVVAVIVVLGIVVQVIRVQRANKHKFNLEKDAGGMDDDDDSQPVLGPANDDNDMDDDEDDGPSVGNDRQEAPVAHHQSRQAVEPAEPEQRKPAQKKSDGPEVALVVYVLSRDPKGFKGPALLQSILESGLRYGTKNIFHRHESLTGNGEVLFSMANAVHPGTFDLDDIDHFTTRAVSFYMTLPGPSHPKEALDAMLGAARKLASELDGQLKDDQRSVFTKQIEEIYRQRIVEFERRH